MPTFGSHSMKRIGNAVRLIEAVQINRVGDPAPTLEPPPEPYHFEVLQGFLQDSIRVRGGWWSFYAETELGEDVFVKVGLEEGEDETDSSAEEGGIIFTAEEYTADISLTDDEDSSGVEPESGVVYLRLETDVQDSSGASEESSSTPTVYGILTAHFAAAMPSAEDGVFLKQIATIEADSGGSYDIIQDWIGGNILYDRSSAADVSADPYHFEVVRASDSAVKVRCGSWSFYELVDEERQRDEALLEDGLLTTFSDLLAIGDSSGAEDSVVYLKLSGAEDSSGVGPPSLTVHLEEELPLDEPDVYIWQLATIESSSDGSYEIIQDWNGGNVSTYTLPTTTIEVITDIRYDTTSKQIQVIRKEIEVTAVGDITSQDSSAGDDWEMITGGQAASCDDS